MGAQDVGHGTRVCHPAQEVAPHIDVIAAERHANIMINGIPLCQLAISSDGRPMMRFIGEGFAWTILSEEPLGPDNVPIEVFVTKALQEEDVALPRWHRERVSPKPTPTRTVYRPNTGTNAPQVNSSEVDAIIEEIVMSWVREPNQTKSRTSQITHAIAANLHVEVMSVAGVRANLTRGTYGETLETKIQAKVKHLKSLALLSGHYGQE